MNSNQQEILSITAEFVGFNRDLFSFLTSSQKYDMFVLQVGEVLLTINLIISKIMKENI